MKVYVHENGDGWLAIAGATGYRRDRPPPGPGWRLHGTWFDFARNAPTDHSNVNYFYVQSEIRF
jgi:hypothetical protein